MYTVESQLPDTIGSKTLSNNENCQTGRNAQLYKYKKNYSHGSWEINKATQQMINKSVLHKLFKKWKFMNPLKIIKHNTGEYKIK